MIKGAFAALAIVLPAAFPTPLAADMLDTSGVEPWELCGLCHGLDGNSATSRFPRIAGQKAAYIERQVRAFRSGTRTNDGGQMQSIVHEIEEDDIARIARYFAGQTVAAPEPWGDDGASGAALFAAGRDGVPACATCHAADAAPPEGLVPPHLTAQHRDYLAKQLEDFAAGDRDDDPGGVMQAIASQLTGAEIAALADYLSQTPRAAP